MTKEKSEKQSGPKSSHVCSEIQNIYIQNCPVRAWMGKSGCRQMTGFESSYSRDAGDHVFLLTSIFSATFFLAPYSSVNSNKRCLCASYKTCYKHLIGCMNFALLF